MNINLEEIYAEETDRLSDLEAQLNTANRDDVKYLEDQIRKAKISIEFINKLLKMEKDAEGVSDSDI